MTRGQYMRCLSDINPHAKTNRRDSPRAERRRLKRIEEKQIKIKEQ